MMILTDYEASWNNNEMMGIRVTDPNVKILRIST